MRIIQDYRHFVPNGKVGFVPTMGALHEGHLSLVKVARQQCDTLVASIFVNPTQFGVNEDLDMYPRPLERDIHLLQEAGCDVLYVPTVQHMYPEIDLYKTDIHISPVMDVLCGAKRTGHFSGVCLILSKFFNRIKPDFVFMGQKDWQQCVVVQKLIDNMDFNIDLVKVPTIREQDGLALSSRNQYLSTQERQVAPALQATLLQVAQQNITCAQGIQFLLDNGFRNVDYLEIRDQNTLLSHNMKQQRVFGAAYLGQTRLIDNVAVSI